MHHRCVVVDVWRVFVVSIHIERDVFYVATVTSEFDIDIRAVEAVLRAGVGRSIASVDETASAAVSAVSAVAGRSAAVVLTAAAAEHGSAHAASSARTTER